MTNSNFRKIYYTKNVYDGHFIYYLMNDLLHLDCEKEIYYYGENIYVREDQYLTALKFVTEELLRREPQNEVKWIDYYQKARKYNNFCYGALKLKSEYIDSELLPSITNQFHELWNSVNNLDGKGPISINLDKKGYIYLEGNICYDQKEEFWSDLRYLGLNETFSKRRKYCYDIMKENMSSISSYADLYYIPTIDGELDKEISLQTDLKINDSIQKVIKKS